jgi:hypothetical protein
MILAIGEPATSHTYPNSFDVVIYDSFTAFCVPLSLVLDEAHNETYKPHAQPPSPSFPQPSRNMWPNPAAAFH